MLILGPQFPATDLLGKRRGCLACGTRALITLKVHPLETWMSRNSGWFPVALGSLILPREAFAQLDPAAGIGRRQYGDQRHPQGRVPPNPRVLADPSGTLKCLECADRRTNSPAYTAYPHQRSLLPSPRARAAPPYAGARSGSSAHNVEQEVKAPVPPAGRAQVSASPGSCGFIAFLKSDGRGTPRSIEIFSDRSAAEELAEVPTIRKIILVSKRNRHAASPCCSYDGRPIRTSQ